MLRCVVLTTLLAMLLTAPAVAQIAVAVVPPGNQGVLELDALGNGVFAVVAINLGATPGPQVPGPPLGTGPCGWFEVRATGGATTLVCFLDTDTGACLSSPAEVLHTNIYQGDADVYGVLVFGPVPSGRVSVTFTQVATVSAATPFFCAFPGEPVVRIVGPERGAVSIPVARPGGP